MKSEIYNALATINRGFDVALESLTILEQAGVLSNDYVQQHFFLNKLETRSKFQGASVSATKKSGLPPSQLRNIATTLVFIGENAEKLRNKSATTPQHRNIATSQQTSF